MSLSRLAAGAVAAALAASAPAYAQSPRAFDFEQGYTGWTVSGDAFAAQPAAAGRVDTSVAGPVTLGGDYWRDLPYSLGQSGDFLARSSDAGRGTLVSDPFTLQPGDRYLRALIGGEADADRARLELQVRDAPGSAIQALSRDGDFAVVWQAAGRGPDTLAQAVFEIPQAWTGREARLVVRDRSSEPGAHINVDAIAFSAAPPPPHRPPVWGLADYHTHPMNHLAFGGLRGIRTIWGAPGGAARDYATIPSLIGRDMPPCVDGHHGGPSAEVFINVAEGRFVPGGGPLAWLTDLFGLLVHGLGHGHRGAPGFGDFPGFRSGLHHQMHVTQIRRAWEGGLRLMVAIAVHNQGLEFVMSPLANGAVTPTTEREVLDAQVCGMRQLAVLNDDWMQIAYSAGDARDIIGAGKLAIVLGVEMDQLGELGGLDSPAAEVQYLWDLGIRQVTPIHAVDNTLGGAAVFQPIYNSLNDMLHRGVFTVARGDLDAVPPAFFEVRDGSCEHGALEEQWGECVLFNLEPGQRRGSIGREAFAWFRRTPFLTAWHHDAYEGYRGMMNVRGLTPAGAGYLRELMRRGMLIGLEHMSDRTVEDVYGVLGGADGYPLLVSHAHFRRLSLQARGRDPHEDLLPSEYEVSDRQAEMLRRTSGLVGQFTAMEPVVYPEGLPAPPVVNDCGGSSKTFAQSLAYALSRMGGRGVGLATDFTVIDSTAPRFGEYACWRARPDAVGDDSPLAGQYARGAQRNGVDYEGAAPARGVRVRGAAPLVPYRMGNRRYDINVDGFAHYGLLPDLLQDARNVGVPREAFEALFSSAEDYLQTWERAEQRSGHAPGGFVPLALPCTGDEVRLAAR